MRTDRDKPSTTRRRLLAAACGILGGLGLIATNPVRAGASPLVLGLAESWGYDLYDQAGLGSPFNQSPTGISLPLPANAVTGVTGVAAGGYHSLALKSGNVIGWGRNFEGELGNGGGGFTATAVEAQTSAGNALGGVTAVVAGTWHSLALTSAGNVYAFGSNSFGQLGDGTTTDSGYAVEVMKDSTHALTGITQIAAGGFHSLALDSSGNVWGWGQGGTVGDGTNTDRSFATQVSSLPTAGHTVTDIAAGHDHSLAVESNGIVWSWGSDGTGQLGDNTTGAGSNSPVHVLNSSGGNLNLGTSSSLAWPLHRLAGGNGHSLALTSTGTVVAWGDDSLGQLGDWKLGDQPCMGCVKTTAQPVSSEAGSTVGPLTGVQSVSAGGAHSLSLQSDGTARGWGADIMGQVGDGTLGDPRPRIINPLDPVTTALSGCFCRSTPAVVLGVVLGYSIAAGGGHSVVALL